MNIAVFCPRLPDEDQASWKKRWEACHRLARTHTRAASIDLFDLFDMQIYHTKKPLRKIIVARKPFYTMEFHYWVLRSRVEVIDVLESDVHAPAWLEEMRR